MILAKEEVGLLTATEVANPHHVELALKHDVDILWFNCRSTVSPFIVQDIADSLKGVSNPVLIKNQLIQIWYG